VRGTKLDIHKKGEKGNKKKRSHAGMENVARVELA